MKFCSVLFFLIIGISSLKAQSEDYKKLSTYSSSHVSVKSAAKSGIDYSSKPLLFPFKLLFGFYRKNISEQISADCAFDLTCSRFSTAAIYRFGIIKGGLLTGDRLTRCHVFVSHETVPVLFNNQTGKVIDEPEMY